MKAGLASSYWEVGDSKAVTLNGGVGTLTFSNETYYAFILGFDHNLLYEGTNKLHMAFGKTADGKDIAFCDAAYGLSGEDAIFHINPNETNSGGWANSYMRNTICSQFYNALPSDLRGVITACTKYSDNTGGGNNIASYVTETSDNIWLLSEFEVQGTRTKANSVELNFQTQYDYYKNGNSKVRYQHNNTNKAITWWLRSVFANDIDNFCVVYVGGDAGDVNVLYSCGLAPCFVIG